MKLENKVAIVTGGGKGIGAEICLKLAKEGAKIVIAEMDIKIIFKKYYQSYIFFNILNCCFYTI